MSRAIRLLPGEGEKIAGPWGRSIVLKATGADTAAHYSILEFTAAPGAPRATHPRRNEIHKEAFLHLNW